MLIRRNDVTGEHAYLRCYSPRPVPLRALVAVAGQRWRIEESFQAAKGALPEMECGVGQDSPR